MRSLVRAIPWILLSALIFAAAFWAGLIWHFPGAAFSRYLESLANRDGRVAARIDPAELGWTRLSIPRVRIDGDWQGTWVALVALNDVEIPLSWRLLRGLPARAGLGGTGVIEVFWPWGPGEARLAARGLRLEAIPALTRLPAKRVEGGAELEGTVRVRPGELPEGRLRGRIQGLEIGGIDIFGQTIPVTRIEDVQLQADLGASWRVESLNVRGDLQGSVEGTVTPNPRRPELSALDLQVNLGVRPEWLEQLGALAPIAQGLLDDGRLAGTLQGTPARPVFRKARSRS